MGAVPPQLTACAPPSEDCAPKKLTGSGLLERKPRSKLVFFVDWHQILWHFWYEDLFFFGDHLFSAEKTAEFAISAEKSLWLFAPHLVYFIQTG